MSASRPADATTEFKARFVGFAVALGLASGLVEGVGHIVLQKLNVVENSWYQIVWISAAFNGLILGLLALIVSAGLSRLPRTPLFRRPALFVIVAAAAAPVFALMLKEWIFGRAILILTAGVCVAVTRWLEPRHAAVFRWCRRGLPAVAALTAVTFVIIQGGFWLQERRAVSRLPPATTSTPNIVLVVVDTLRADHLSSYGYLRQTSPNIDRLAAEGVLFEQAFATSSYTLPSHTSLLTGLYPFQHGVEWQTFNVQVTATYPTLPEVLQTRGYRTAAFSANTSWFTRAHGFGRGFIHFDEFFYSISDAILRTAYGRLFTRLLHGRFGWVDIPARRRAPEVNRAALDWIASDPHRPFFIVINYMEVHDPYFPPEPYASRFSGSPNRDTSSWLQGTVDGQTPEDVQRMIDAYDGAIAGVDDQLAALWKALRAHDDDRELLIILTSDHGEEFGEHGGFLHATHLYRETIQVPLVLWQPGTIPADRRISQPVSNASVPATILDLLDGADSTFAGPSLRELWAVPGANDTWPYPISELEHRSWMRENAPVRSGGIRSVVGDGWHYIEHSALGPELYDADSDPLDQHDVSQEPEQQATVRRFRAWLAGELGVASQRGAPPR